MYFLLLKQEILLLFLFSMILKEKRNGKIKQVSKKIIPLFYFSRFGWSYNRTIQVLFLLFFPSQYQADNSRIALSAFRHMVALEIEFVDEILGSVSGKKILLFGSYGWGDGEWMRNWVEQMTGAGAEMIEAEGIIANEAPDADAQAACEAAGKALAANV